MKRDEKKGGRIRRAEAQPVLWFSLSLAASLHSFQRSLLHNLLLFITAAELLSNCNAFLFAREKSHLWPWEYVRPHGERESETCLASHLASPLHLGLHVQYSQPRVVEQRTWPRCSWGFQTEPAEQEHVVKTSTPRCFYRVYILLCSYSRSLNVSSLHALPQMGYSSALFNTMFWSSAPRLYDQTLDLIQLMNSSPWKVHPPCIHKKVFRHL